MKRTATLAAALLATLTASAAEPKVIRLEKATFESKELGIPVATVLKPEGWKMEGSLKLNMDYVHQFEPTLMLTNPKKYEGVTILPVASYIYADSPGFPVKRFERYYGGVFLEPMSPTEFGEMMAEKLNTRDMPIRVTGSEDLPELAKYYAKVTGDKSVKAGKVSIQLEKDGVKMDGEMYFAFHYAESKMPGTTLKMMSPVVHPYIIATEKGNLKAARPKLLAVAESFRTTEKFEVARAIGLAHLNKRHQDALDQIRDLSIRISVENDAMIARISADRKTRWAAEDKASRDFSDYLLGVQRYTDGGTSYSLPSGYSNAWADGSGNYYLSNDPSDDPNSTLKGTWKSLKAVK